MPKPPLNRLLRLALPLLFLPVAVTTVVPQQQQPVSPLPMINASEDPLLASFRFRSIGPASMGGRIDDIEAAPSDHSIIYVGYAAGGVWKSENNGTTWTPVFDTYTTASIGDIAIHPTNPNIVYVGTGEANNRQTTTFGDGIYKTTDGGKSFQHVGLRETQSIARILIDPKNPETVYVAAPGHLFGPNKERGIYKSTDGGKSWNNVKFIDEHTGFTDIAMDPVNSNVLYAASYQRLRTGCCFNGGGPGSAVWKTADAGKTWTKMTGNGLPPGTYGRIALDVSRSNPNVLYVQIEASDLGQRVTTEPNDPRADTEATPTNVAAAAGSPGARTPAQQTGRGQQPAAPQPQPQAGGQGRGGQYDWCNNGGPGRGFGRGRGGEVSEQTPPPLNPGRGGIFRSDNKGGTWTHVSNCNARPMYFSQIRVDPTNDKVVYAAGLPWAKSLDGGRTFATLNEAGGHGSPGHVDQHAMWIDPKNPKHLMIGNDGGFNVTYDQGRTWDFINTMTTSLAYWVSADMRRPYYVYVGLQDNGSWGGPSATRTGDGILNSDWFGIGGGDGFQTAVDPTDYHIVYTESQNGSTSRYDLRTNASRSIRPVGRRAARGAPGGQAGQPGQPPQPGQAGQAGQAGGGGRGGGRGGVPNVLNSTENDENYRFNWNTPFQLSPHNPEVIWIGGNRLFKSVNRGDTWMASGDLTKQIDRNKMTLMGVAGDRAMLSKNDGVTAYSTIISLSESPVIPGLVWVGTDDGLVQVTRDDGKTFTEVGKNLPGLPANHLHWISRIEASHFDPAVAYVAVDGHRDDDLKPHLFVTRDYGKTWESLAGTLPQFGNIQVVREDPRNRNLLYVGTEFGLYVSLDGGKRWQKFMNNLPTGRVDDILIHPRDNDLIVATHARGVWIADDITPLQQLGSSTPDLKVGPTGAAQVGPADDAVLFDVRPAVAWMTDRQQGQYTGGQKYFAGENPPRGAAINYYLKSAGGEVKITIADTRGETIRTLTGPGRAGINRVMWNLTSNPPQGPGEQQAGRGGGGGGGRGGFGGPPVEPGTYVVSITAGGKTLTKPVTVLEDRWLSESR